MSNKYDKTGKLHKLGYINKAWRERIFALDSQAAQLHYFRTEEEFQQNLTAGTRSMAGTIALNTAVMYVADYMEYPFCIELATRDAKAVTTRHFFLFAQTAAEIRGWMEAIVAAGATAAGPSAPMRAVPEGKRPASALLGADASPTSPSSYNSTDDNSLDAAAASSPLPFPVRLAKYGFLQKRGALNTSYKTRFCRVETNLDGQPVLVYYSSVEVTGRSGTIPLTGIRISEDEKAPDQLGFVLTTAPEAGGRSYVMRAPSKAAKRKWCDILRRVGEGERIAPMSEPEVHAAQVEPLATPSAAAAAAAATPGRPLVSMNAAPAVAAAAVSVAAASSAFSPSPSPSPATPAPSSSASVVPAPVTPVGLPGDVRVVTKDDGRKFKRRVVKISRRRNTDSDDDDADGPGFGDDSVDHSRDVSVVVSPAMPAPAKSNTPQPVTSPVSNAMATPSGPASPPHFPDSPYVGTMDTPATSPMPLNRGDHSPSSRQKSNARATAALQAEIDKQRAEIRIGAAAAAAESSVSRKGADSASVSASAAVAPSGDGLASPGEVAASLGRLGAGTEVFKVPTGSFASVEKKRFYLLPVGSSEKATELLTAARREMKGKKDKKVAYFNSIRSGYLLHWDSSKAHAYESFVWLNPEAPRSEWSLVWGQSAGLFTKKKLKAEYHEPAVVRRSFTLITPKRTIDLIVDKKDDFTHWHNVLAAIDAQR